MAELIFQGKKVHYEVHGSGGDVYRQLEALY